MKFKLFKNGDQFPLMGLGTWLSKTNEVYDAVLSAIKVGYRHIDCASIYGNEKEIGKALNVAFSQGLVKRNEMFITSKLWNNCHLPEHVEPALRKTLSDLQLDYLDMYLIHWPIAFEYNKVNAKTTDDLIPLSQLPIEQTWSAMIELKKSDLVKHIGVSNFSILKLKNLIDSSDFAPEMNQVEIHPYFNQEALLGFCNENDILVTAYSPLGSRHLIANEQSITLENVIIEIAKKHNCTQTQVLLAWGLERETAVIPKSVNNDRIKNNFEAINVTLDKEDVLKINSLNKNTRMSKALFAVLPNGCYTYSNIWDEPKTLTYSVEKG